jgi:hypothetical protein
LTLYQFEVNLAVDPNNPDVILRGGQVTFYDPADVGLTTPLSLYDTNGLPLANPVTVSQQGFTPAFQADIPQVMWVGYGYSGYVSSFQSIYDQVLAVAASAAAAQSAAEVASVSAEAAQAAAEAAAVAPTDEAIDEGIVRAGAVGSWEADTAYASGQYVISPDGDLVRALSAHTSAATFEPAFWSTGTSVSKSKLPLNVKDYGAAGDGVADDTLAIQACLNAVPDGGRAVYFPAGRYKVTSTLRVEKDGTTLFGDGVGNRIGATQVSNGSRIEASGSVTGSVIQVQRAANDRPLQGVQIHDLTVDGGLVGFDVAGILFRSNQGHIERVHIWRCSGVGLKVMGYASPAWDTYDTTFSQLIIGNCNGYGAELATDSADTHWSHCIFLSNLANFVNTGGASFQITSCHFYSPVTNNLLFNGSGTRSKLVNCKIEGSGEHQLVIDTTNGGYSDIQITGCGFSSVSQSSVTNTYDLIHITGPSGSGAGRTVIVGNSFNNKGGNSVKARYAINLATSAAQNTAVLANNFGPASHWGTAAYNNASNSSLVNYVRGNTGLGDVKPWNVQTVSYTLTAADCDAVVEMNSSSACNVTIPTAATGGFVKGNVIEVCQTGAGQVTFVNASGVTINTPRSLTTRARYSTVRLRMRLTDTWVLDGDLT